MGRTLWSYSLFQTRIVLLEDNGWPRIISSVEYKAFEEVLSVRDSKSFPISYFVKCISISISILRLGSYPLSLYHEEQYCWRVIVVMVTTIHLLFTQKKIVINIWLEDLFILKLELSLVHGKNVINT